LKIERLSRGSHEHLRHYRKLRGRLSGGQDPKVFCLSCSDSRVLVHDIFGLPEPGTIFEVKNIGGLITKDAKSGLIYVMEHLRPEYIILLHHTGCGGYRSLLTDVEPEIREHMARHGGLKAKENVRGFLGGEGIKVSDDVLERLIIEEGLRIQAASLKEYLRGHCQRGYELIMGEDIHLLRLVYDIDTGKTYIVPDKLGESLDMRREEF
jgi:carbonic anhydrase